VVNKWLNSFRAKKKTHKCRKIKHLRDYVLVTRTGIENTPTFFLISLMFGKTPKLQGFRAICENLITLIFTNFLQP
jgi:hypothetical protein